MTITKIRAVPENLPMAHLYLEDLQEVEEILRKAYTPFIRDRNRFTQEMNPEATTEEPTFTYTVADKTVADSLTDLPNLGRSSTDVKISLQPYDCAWLWIWSYKSTLRLRHLADDQSWAIYGQIQQVFNSRRLVLKDSLHSMPAWIYYLTYPAVIFLVFSVQAIFGKQPKAMWATYASVVLVLALVAFQYFRPNRLFFERSTEKHTARSESRRRLARDIIFLLLGTGLGEIVKKVIAKVF